MIFGESLTLETGLLAVAALLSLTFIAVRLSRFAKERVLRARESAASPPAHARGQANLPEVLGELVLELDELSRRITKQADESAAKLDAAVRAADERIAHLGTLLAEERKPEPARASRFRPSVQDGVSDRARRVCELADAGTQSLNIAETLDMPLAEVELVLSLRSMSLAAPPSPPA